MNTLLYRINLQKKQTFIKVRNKAWNSRGGSLLAWLDTHLPDYHYILKFVKNKNGKVIAGRPITIEFGTHDPVFLIALIGIDLE